MPGLSKIIHKYNRILVKWEGYSLFLAARLDLS